MPSPLEVLGLPPGSTQAEVKVRYKELAQAQHPDHGGDVATFLATNMAYKQALAEAPEHHGCPTCHGEGTVTQVHGFHQLSTVCPTCMGEGHL